MEIQTKPSKRKYPKGRDITIENIREYPGLENLSDADAQQAVSSIRVLARMFYDEYMRSLTVNKDSNNKEELI